jgi:acyl-CoA synthetase (AMP-forming)/AMP-acid ligase II
VERDGRVVISVTGSLPGMLKSIACERPDAPALSGRQTRWSYGDLGRAMDATAAFLQRRGSVPGDRVALLFRNSPQYVSAYYGALLSGCVVVPLNPHESKSVLAHQLAHCGARFLIGDPGHVEWGGLSAVSRRPGIDSIDVAADDEADALPRYLRRMGGEAVADEIPLCPDSLATVIYTSGTTGRPKGVMLSHRNLVANTASIISYLGLKSQDRGIAVLPFQFSYGNSVLHTHLAVGAELLIEYSFAFPHAVLRRMAEAKVTGFSGVPSTFSILLARCCLDEFDLTALRYITQAGGPMRRATIRQLRAKLPGTRLFVMYGQTEATARLSYLPPEMVDEKPGSVGIAIPDVELAVLRPDGSRAGPNETGEIVARGPNVMQGYLDDVASSRETLRGGWLHTGDMGYLDEDGLLFVTGRATEMIKVGAFRVSPQEVEEVIATMPGVAEVGVTAVPDEILGQAIKAVIVMRPGERLDVRRVRAQCRRNLAMYKVPKLVEFAAALPYTATGKLQRLRLG